MKDHSSGTFMFNTGTKPLETGTLPPCYWDDLLAKQTCPKHGVPVAECPIDLTDAINLHEQTQGLVVNKAIKSEEQEIPPDKPHEGGLKVSHYSVHCQNCGHPSLWHWHNEDSGQTGKCRGYQCRCLKDIPGPPISPMCEECNHPIRWHDQAGPRCTAVNCSCPRTAA